MGLGIAQYVQGLRNGLNDGWTVVGLSAGTTNFFLDGNKLGLGVQLTPNLHPVTKMRISGVNPSPPIRFRDVLNDKFTFYRH
jgi:hypothetical protein